MKRLLLVLSLLTTSLVFGATEYEKQVSDALKQDIKIAKNVLKGFGKIRSIDTHTSDIISSEYFFWTNVKGEATYRDGSKCKIRVVSTAKDAVNGAMKGFSVRCYEKNGTIYLDTFDPGVKP